MSTQEAEIVPEPGRWAGPVPEGESFPPKPCEYLGHAYPNLSMTKVRVEVGVVWQGGNEDRWTEMVEWPLDQAFYIRHLDKDGTETIYRLYPFCQHNRVLGRCDLPGCAKLARS